VPKRDIERIREKIRLRQYDMTVHAMEEMAEDSLDILDIEHGILNGQVARIEKDDPRGTKYTVEGPAVVDEQTLIGIVGRFTDTGRYLIITVYAISDSEE
jgi:hypothetical protein